MKKSIITLFLSFVCLLSFAQKDNYKVTGTIKNCTDTTASLTIWIGDDATRDKMAIKNGKFVMSGNCTEPMIVRASFSNKSLYKSTGPNGHFPYKCSSLWFIIYPGANANYDVVLDNFVNAKCSGDYENKMLTTLTSTIFPIMSQEGDINVKLAVDKNLTDDEKTALKAKAVELNSSVLSKMKEFIDANHSSYAAVWFINDMMLRKQLTPAEAKVYLDKVSEKYKSSAWYDMVVKRIESTNLTIGSKLTNFKSKSTVDGSEFSLESMKGKYVIIDFWGTWCGPCMGGMDHMRSFRDENASKVEILGIAKDKKEGWLASIKKDNLNWVHILNGKGDEDFVSKLNVTGYPTKILLSPDGTILYRESGESPTFYTKVKEFIK